jgi:hypothetical protein
MVDLKLECHRRAPARDTQTRRSPARELERSKSEMERETGSAAPSTKQAVEFCYRLG